MEKGLKKGNILKFLVDMFFVTLACMIMAFAFAAFCIPLDIAPGGFSGLATVIYSFTGAPVGAVCFILCIPLFVIIYKDMGAINFLKTLYGTFAFSFFIDIMTGKFDITNDLFLASVFGGIVFGVGVGLLFKFKGTTGGTELLALLIQKRFPHFTMGNLILILDGMVVLIAGIAFRNFEIMVYSGINIFIATKVIDFIQEGTSYTKAFYIFTSDPKGIRNAIFETLDRGVTFIKAKGGYSNEDKDILLCVVSRMEVAVLRELISDIDPDAFVILAEVSEVLGEGFKGVTEE